MEYRPRRVTCYKLLPGGDGSGGNLREGCRMCTGLDILYTCFRFLKVAWFCDETEILKRFKIFGDLGFGRIDFEIILNFLP